MLPLLLQHLVVLILQCVTGYLSIMAADQSSYKEVLEAESPGMASDLNRSDLDPIYIGGLPASRPIRWVHTVCTFSSTFLPISLFSPVCLVGRRQVVSRSYVGCIKNVEIARSNFDLLRDAFGVRKGCVLEVLYTHCWFLNIWSVCPLIVFVLTD